MPFKSHYRVTALGTLGTSQERFSYGLNMAPNNGAGDANGVEGTITLNDDAWADVAEDLRSFHGAAGTHLSSRAVLTGVKVAKIGADGKYLEDPKYFDVVDTPGGSTLSSNSHLILPQTAVAVSLVTARRGPSGKGRFYLPMPIAGIDAGTFEADPTIITSIRDSAQTLINDLNNAPGFDLTEVKVCVASTKGFNTGVTGVRVGRILDTIRTRRAQLVENHTAVAAVS